MISEPCERCKRKSNIFLPYLGKSLCNSCFVRLQEQRISRNIKNNSLVKEGDKIAIALSGGKDSAVVVNFLKKSTNYKKVLLKAFYVDRGDEASKKNRKMCEKICKEAEIELEVLSFLEKWDFSMKDIIQVSTSLGVNRCSVCGVLRRRILDFTAREQGFNKLATGHNLTDEAQTFLMNFSKGDLNSFSHVGSKSLPKRKEFVQRIKILRSIPENEVKKYADLKNIKYCPDSCACRIGSLRFNFMNYLESMKKTRPGIEFSIVKIGDKIGDILRQKKSSSIKKCIKCGEHTSNDVCQVCKYLEIKKKIN